MFVEGVSVYDFYVDLDATPAEFRRWDTILPEFVYNKNMPFSKMLVPTVDTIRFSSLLKNCLDVNQAVLFTGVHLLFMKAWSAWQA